MCHMLLKSGYVFCDDVLITHSVSFCLFSFVSANLHPYGSSALFDRLV